MQGFVFKFSQIFLGLYPEPLDGRARGQLLPVLTPAARLTAVSHAGAQAHSGPGSVIVHYGLGCTPTQISA
jgi:hypothetical protein